MYATLEYAQTYIGNHFEARSLWNPLEPEDQTALLQAAFQLLEGQTWIGYKAIDAQPNQFPRDISMYFDRIAPLPFEIQHLMIVTNLDTPDNLARAQFEIVIDYLINQENQSLRALQRSNVTSFDLGDMSFEFGSKDNPFPLPVSAWELVKWWHVEFWQTSIKRKIQFRRG